MPTAEVSRFEKLFVGSERSFGEWDPATKKVRTIRGVVTTQEFENHLNGTMGVGMVPIHADNVVLFAVIDIDTHGPNAQDISIEKISAKVEQASLPLIACRSKSGGVHCYRFYEKPVHAAFARSQLKEYARLLGVPSAEIFPKQERLVSAEQLGNWINLPYFKASDTDRYCMVGGKAASLEFFLDLAESSRGQHLRPQSASGLTLDFTEAPPCITKIYDERRGDGLRNNTIFQAGVWLKRQYSDDWRKYLEVFNETAFSKPVGAEEFKKIANSVGRRDYAYKCKDEPCLSVCDRDSCLKKKFGVQMGQDYSQLPDIEGITKIATDPPTWMVKFLGTEIPMTTQQLVTPFEFHKRVLDLTSKLIPIPRGDDWKEFLDELLAQKLETKGEESGILRDEVFTNAFQQVMRDAQGPAQEPDMERRKQYARDMGPAVITGETGINYVVFKFAHLEQRLRQQFSIKMTSEKVAANLHLAGARTIRTTLGGRRVNMWSIAYEKPEEGDKPYTVFKSEF